MLLYIWLYFISKLCRYTILNLVKILAKKLDEDDSNSDEMVEGHEIYFDDRKKKQNSLS